MANQSAIQLGGAPLRHPVSSVTPSAERLLLFALLCAGAVIRLYHLEFRSLWLDELTSLSVSSFSPSDILSGRNFNRHTPPFYYLLLHFWLEVFPANEFGLRLFSTVFDLGNIGLVVMIFSRQFSRCVGVSAGALYAISPYAVYYAQEGRMYSLTLFLVLLVYALALRAKDGCFTQRDAVMLWLVGCCGVYCHYYFALAFFAITLGLLPGFRQDRSARTRWMLACIAVLVCFIPWINVVLGLIGEGGQPFRRFSFLVLPYAFFRFVAGYAVLPLNVGAKQDVVATVLQHWPYVAAYILVFGTITLAGLAQLRRSFEAERLIVLTPLLVVPLLALLITMKIPMLSERYLIVVFPLFLLLLVLFMTNGSRQGLKQAIVYGFSLFGLVQYFVNPQFGNEQWRDVANYIRSAQVGSRLVVVNPEYTKDVLGFYLKPPYTLLGIKPNVDQFGLFTTELFERAETLEPSFWLVERGGSPSLKDPFANLGLAVEEERLFPLDNGLMLYRFRHREGE